MPIRVSCSCGQVLNVPDAMAGKSGKCPKCSNIVKIPAAGAQPAAAKGTQPAAAKSAKPVAAAKPAAAAPKNRKLDDLFEEAGIVQQKGNVCPKCEAPAAAGAVLCIKCGFNFSTGEVLVEHQVQSKVEKYGNVHLDEAAVMMQRDEDTEKRSLAAGSPWWVLLCVLLGCCILCAAGIIIVDGNTNGKQPKGTFIGDVQNASIGVVLMGVAAAMSGLIYFFAWMNLVVMGFREKPKWGLLTLFIPLFAVIYGFMRYKLIKGTVRAIVGSLIVGIPCGIGFAVNW